MNRKTENSEPPTTVPPAIAAVVCELLGRCPRCSAPLTYTPAGWCSLVHEPGCPLAEAVEAT